MATLFTTTSEVKAPEHKSHAVCFYLGSRDYSFVHDVHTCAHVFQVQCTIESSQHPLALCFPQHFDIYVRCVLQFSANDWNLNWGCAWAPTAKRPRQRRFHRLLRERLTSSRTSNLLHSVCLYISFCSVNLFCDNDTSVCWFVVCMCFVTYRPISTLYICSSVCIECIDTHIVDTA
jgi:hypothetical protein